MICVLVPLLCAGVKRVGTATAAADGIDPASYQRDGCGPAPLPDSLPAASQIIDVDAALAVLAVRYPRVGEPVFAVRFEANGIQAPVHLVDSPFRESVSDSLGQIVATHLSPQPASDQVWGVRLRLTHEATPAFVVERSVYCPPESELRPDELRLTFQVSGSSTTGRPPQPSVPRSFRNPKARVLVDVDGRANEIRIITSSGNYEFDRALEEGLRDVRFIPALLDGVPIEAWWETGERTPS